jgi:cytochrome oxidase assembly protein ShyY1
VAAPLPADPPDFGIGINLAYAFQWWAFAVTAYVLLGVAMIREVRRTRASTP